MSSSSPDIQGDWLRARGLRSTPQRRAILGVFGGGRTEHLSADEVYSRAVRVLPELSRATVYATLAEFSELGLLSAFGTPEPVRYETTVEPHAHLRCYTCLRLFDLPGASQNPEDIVAPGFIVKRVETRAEGICDECIDYDAGITDAAHSMLEPGPPPDSLEVPGAAAATLDSPLGKLLLAATPLGLTRIAFEDHRDAQLLRAHAASRRGSKAAHQHLSAARDALVSYFAGDTNVRGYVVDWQKLGPAAQALQRAQAIPYASHSSYSDLELEVSPRDLGLTFGSNPIPILAPCHRVSRGTEMPTDFVGGAERRAWLDAHEQAISVPG
jgi:Fe2+ or Zn2+ uptake regulation protein/O6-methylguanine-DNA--protein-cysteine methyltransferase